MKNENRLRRLEESSPLPGGGNGPFREVSFGWRSEEEFMYLRALARAALAGNAAAEAELDRRLSTPPLPRPPCLTT